MKPKTCIVHALILCFVPYSQCIKNNVCPTIKDYYTVKDNPNCWYDVAADSNVTEIIRNYGYSAEEHQVITPDGYILSLFRVIPNYRNRRTIPRKNPVFLQHGWLYSGASFVGLGKQSLAFLLVDAGYDVWLGNFRGTDYSEGHVNLTVFDKEYWDFSVDHIGLYDIPTMLRHISRMTGQRGNIVYIGHSLGTAVGYIYGSSYLEEAKNTVKLFISLAPAGQLIYTKSMLFRALGLFMNALLKLIDDYGLIRLVSQGSAMKKIIQHLCLESPTVMERCMQLTNWVILGPRTQMEQSKIPVFLNQLPAGTSFKVLKQITGMLRTELSRYNYGSKNMEIYGSRFPPTYNIFKIDIPIFIMYATADWCCTKRDSVALYENLSRNARIYGIHEINNPDFNHNDFIYGKNAKTIVYDIILRLLEKIDGDTRSILTTY